MKLQGDSKREETYVTYTTLENKTHDKSLEIYKINYNERLDYEDGKLTKTYYNIELFNHWCIFRKIWSDNIELSHIKELYDKLKNKELKYNDFISLGFNKVND